MLRTTSFLGSLLFLSLAPEDQKRRDPGNKVDVKDKRIKEMITQDNSLDVDTNSPNQNHNKDIITVRRTCTNADIRASTVQNNILFQSIN